ncbi:MAG: murein L,D-transpeptidase catalytic domain family protein [Verrucomicrobiae bacterium]|nr:murein L,D-transpeptidase catalytic domain family protein [Verrucomicrobiae bacterium]
MKLTVPRWGGILAVVIAASALARHATSSSSDVAPLVQQEMAQGTWADETLAIAALTPVSEESIAASLPLPVVSSSPMPQIPLATKTAVSLETIATLPFSIPSESSVVPELVLDKPPASPTPSGNHRPLIESPPQPAPVAVQASESLPSEEYPPEADAEPAPITEAEARATVLNLLGGEAEYRAQESDMALAYAAAKKALRQQGIRLANVKALAIIDFTLPSYDRRLAIYNPRTGEESRHLVAHGHHSGDLYVRSYSNVPGSLQSSPGLYRVGEQYTGEHGRSIRLHGLQKDINDYAFKRDVVLHSAWYVSYKTILENQLELGVPRIGRSHGCPAVSAEDLPDVLQKLKPGSYLFIYPVPAYVPSPLPEVQAIPALRATERVLR